MCHWLRQCKCGSAFGLSVLLGCWYDRCIFPKSSWTSRPARPSTVLVLANSINCGKAPTLVIGTGRASGTQELGCSVQCHPPIFDIRVSEGPSLGGGLLTFRQRALNAARSFGSSEIELIGLEVRNRELRAALLREGFEAANLPVPPSLGGGTTDAFGKIFPLR